MNSRERFLATMAFEPVDRPPLWEMGYWGGAIRRWYREGLPRVKGLPDSLADGDSARGGFLGWKQGAVVADDVHDALALNDGCVRIPVNNYLQPAFTPEVLEDHGEWRLIRDPMGVVMRQKAQLDSLPDYVRGPVATLDDWRALAAERLQPTLEGRLPADWAEFVARYRDPSVPLSINGSHGFFGTPRYLMGVTQVLLAFRDQPELLKEINSYLCGFWIAIFDQVLSQIKADVLLIWEDMCYKTGPLISPAMFEEFMLPYYRRLTGFFRDRGVKVVHVDTDGDCRKLVPLFIQGGVTGLFPWEVTNGQNVAEIGEQYPQLQLVGGIDKKALARGRAAIDAELDSKVPQLLRRGGYVPCADHMVPPDVSWDDFVYYRHRVAEMASQRSGS